MKFVAYNMQQHCGRHFPEKWLIIWQDSNKELKKRFKAYFDKLDTMVGMPDTPIEYQIVNGHVLVYHLDRKYRRVRCVVNALNCQAGVVDTEKRLRDEERLYGEDEVVPVREFDGSRYPGLDRDDPEKNPAMQFVDQVMEGSIPYWDAVKTVPLIPAGLALTMDEFIRVGKLQVKHGLTQRQMTRDLLVAGLAILEAVESSEKSSATKACKLAKK